MAAVARPLLFATIARETARTRGVPTVALDIAFLAIVGLGTAVTVPVVGTLLIYSLAIGPAGAAAYISPRPAATIAVAFLFAALAVVVGIALAYATDWPVGFFIATITALEYAIARVYARRYRPVSGSSRP